MIYKLYSNYILHCSSNITLSELYPNSPCFPRQASGKPSWWRRIHSSPRNSTPCRRTSRVRRGTDGKSPFLMGKSTISMAMFNSYVELPEGICWMVEICEYLWLSDYFRDVRSIWNIFCVTNEIMFWQWMHRPNLWAHVAAWGTKAFGIHLLVHPLCR